MSSELSETSRVCINECGASCCSDDAFLRPEDKAALRANGYNSSFHSYNHSTKIDNDDECVLLDEDGKCHAYDYRPLDCRLFPIGFVLDDSQQVVHVVIVGCSLSESLTDQMISELSENAVSMLDEFSAVSLRQYDKMTFTDDYERIEAVSYDSLEADL